MRGYGRPCNLPFLLGLEGSAKDIKDDHQSISALRPASVREKNIIFISCPVRDTNLITHPSASRVLVLCLKPPRQLLETEFLSFRLAHPSRPPVHYLSRTSITADAPKQRHSQSLELQLLPRKSAESQVPLLLQEATESERESSELKQTSQDESRMNKNRRMKPSFRQLVLLLVGWSGVIMALTFPFNEECDCLIWLHGKCCSDLSVRLQQIEHESFSSPIV